MQVYVPDFAQRDKIGKLTISTGLIMEIVIQERLLAAHVHSVFRQL